MTCQMEENEKRMEQIQKDLKTFDKETKVCNRIQKLYITPIIGTCNLFLEKMTNLKECYGNPDFPDILENLRENLQELIQQYEEDKS